MVTYNIVATDKETGLDYIKVSQRPINRRIKYTGRYWWFWTKGYSYLEEDEQAIRIKLKELVQPIWDSGLYEHVKIVRYEEDSDDYDTYVSNETLWKDGQWI
jgi:hypothetical protein